MSRQAVGRVALRAHMVLLNDRRYRVPVIAAIHDCGEDVVRLWLHRYEQAGVAGLADEARSGRPPNDPLAREIVDTQASGSPRASGHVQSCWTVGLLAAFLAVRFGVVLSCSTVRRYLHQMDWRWRRPRRDDRVLLDGLIWLLRTGSQWSALPVEFGPNTRRVPALYDRFSEWVGSGALEQAWGLLLREYDDLVGLEWHWQAGDGCLVKAPLGKKGGPARSRQRGGTPPTVGKVGPSVIC